MSTFFTKKRVIWGIVIVLVGGFIASRFLGGNQKALANIQTDTVKKQNIQATVLSTGQVVSKVDLNLSFQSSGVVRKVLVKEGDVVKAGQVLANLDQSTVAGALMSARGALAQAQANYEKVLAGASNEQITIYEQAVAAAQVAYDNAVKNVATVKQQQSVLVDNAHRVLLNTTPQAVAFMGNNPGATPPTISGTYLGTQEGSYLVNQQGSTFSVSGLETQAPMLITDSVNAFPVGTKGLYIQFSSDFRNVAETWQITLPNPQATAYGTNYNAYQAALQTQTAALNTAQASVDSAAIALSQAQANLNAQRAAARPADIDAAKAQILSAEGQVASAAAAFNNTVLVAPANGTITQVDIKVGELATALKEVMVLQDVGELHAEANVSEANVASLAVGQSVDYTFDALGPDRHFTGSVTTINPASTVISGVVNYKVTAHIDSNIPEIKPGMTANMTVLVAKKDNAIAVPSSAIINENNGQFVRVIDDAKKKTYHTAAITTGLQADGGLVEIVNGLSEGQAIVTYIKK